VTRTDVAAFWALAIAFTAAAGVPGSKQAAPRAAPVVDRRFVVAPNSVRVFAGNSVLFHVASAGVPPGATGWSVIGPGTIGADGTYRAPQDPGAGAIVVAYAHGFASASELTVVAPPDPSARIALVSCYDGGEIDVRDAGAQSSIGTASTGGAAAGIAADPRRRIAFVASGERLASFDVRSAVTEFSAPIAGVRFSEVALLANGFVVATDNDAGRDRAGVRVFRIGEDGMPVLAASAAAGETPEGLAVSRDGRTFFVTNVNGNSVMRFDFDGRGSVRLRASAATGHRPFGVAVDDTRRLLFVADNDTPTVSGSSSRPGLDVFSLPSMRRIGRLTTGTPNALPLGVGVDSTANRLFVTNEGDGTVTAYSIAPLRRLATLTVDRTPWLPAIDARAQRVYVPSALAGSYSVFDEHSLRPIAHAVPTCGYPTAIAVM
jgi:DNA-binding beta-propeller fold protein YncE